MLHYVVLIIDLLSLAACITILAVVIFQRKKIDCTSLAFILFAFGIITLVSVSNCIENFTSNVILDKYEDYAEILFIPLLIFSIFSLSLHKELNSRIAAEKKILEESNRLANALEGANEGLWDWDLNTNSLYLSAEFYMLLGYKPFSFISNIENWKRLVYRDHSERENEFRKSFFNGNSDSKSVELLLLTKSGIYKWCFLKGKSVEQNPDGAPARISGIILDISQIKQYEDELLIAKQQAEESEKLKSAFIANMSHEIRTPLNGILGFISLLQEDNVEIKKQKEFLGYISQNSTMLLNLINDIIDISKIESDQVHLNLETFSLNKLMEDIYMFYKTTQQPRLQKISLTFSTSLSNHESEIHSDEIRLRQILNNLIDNAFKNTLSGHVKFGYKTTPENELLFFVEDTGVGIEKKENALIFERFRQADSGLKVKKGSGLGLAICKGLVSKLNGKIWVESEPGQGSTFIFTIPYKCGICSSGKETSLPEKNKWSDTKMLIVEDDAISLKYLAEVFKDNGIGIFLTTTGNDAMKKSSEEKNIQIALIDIQLPDIDGYEVLQGLRKINPEILAIAQTAFTCESEKEKCLKSGFDAFISKPVAPSELLKLVEDILHK
ncbi:MAG: ATP-binding protein [Bacteroidales bacterium]